MKVRIGLMALVIAASAAGLALLFFPGLFHLPRSISLLGFALAISWFAAAYFLIRAGNWATFIVVICARLASALAMGFHHPPGSDPASYLEIANNILAGNGIIVGHFHALFPPLYPLLLATFGGTMLSAFVLNTVIDLLAAWTIYRIAGRLPAALYLIWPSVLLNATVPQKEGLMVLLGLMVVKAFLRLRGEYSSKSALKLGFATGLLGLTQPAMVTLPVALAIVMLPKQIVRTVAISLAVAVLIWLPWWVRNYLIFGAFVPLTSGSGFSNLVAVTGSYARVYELSVLPELQGSAQAAREALHHLVTQPLDALANRLTAMGQAFAVEDASALRLNRPEWIPFTQLPYLALLWLAVRGDRMSAVIMGCFIQFAVFGFPFEFAERHRYLLIPLLLIRAVTSWRDQAMRQTCCS